MRSLLYNCFNIFGLFHMGGFILVILIIGLAVLIYVNARKKRERIEKNAENPVKILKARYARGEISQSEYRDILKNLGSA